VGIQNKIQSRFIQKKGVARSILAGIERWQELGLAGSSPYPSPIHEELRVHQEELARFNSARKLRRGLVDLLNVAADGWVLNEHYEAATVAQMQAYEQLLQAVGSGENAYEREQELKALWPFDRK
jgi:hypothetical protein